MIRKLLFYILYYSGISIILKRQLHSNKEVSVLLFHRVADYSDHLWPAMRVDIFEKLIMTLNKNVEIISFSELLKLKELPSKPTIIISFDDGYTDFYDNVMPILIQHKIKANHNICPGLMETSTPPWTQVLSLYLSYRTTENVEFNKLFLNEAPNKISEQRFIQICKQLMSFDDEKREKLIQPLIDHIPYEKIYHLMEWHQLKYCAENKIEFGSHGNYHRNLLMVNDENILDEEINGSFKKIESNIGIKPLVFAFANAMGNEVSKNYLKQSMYRIILISMDNFYRWQPIGDHVKIEIPRINISRNDWREEYLRALGFHIRIKKLLGIFKS
ncbi:MAG TPA: polysaccharide deacetylase family protein [Bacteroidia bacterium]|nr:polysaccharide deacetylase family protein [Bacteroidia bacterium]